MAKKNRQYELYLDADTAGRLAYCLFLMVLFIFASGENNLLDRNRVLAVSTGTAWSLSEQGYWITNRHVADACYGESLVFAPPTEEEEGVKVYTGVDFKQKLVLAGTSVSKEPEEDIALLKGGKIPDYLSLADIKSVKELRGTYAFAAGYPSRAAGEVYLKYMGSDRSSLLGYANGQTFNFTVWAKLDQNSIEATTKGLSGSPVINNDGEVVGVISGGDDRRGRMVAVYPMAVKRLALHAGAPLPKKKDPYEGINLTPISAKNYSAKSDYLRSRLMITKVLCDYYASQYYNEGT